MNARWSKIYDPEKRDGSLKRVLFVKLEYTLSEEDVRRFERIERARGFIGRFGAPQAFLVLYRCLEQGLDRYCAERPEGVEL